MYAQTADLLGKIISENKPVEFASVFLDGTQLGAITDSTGKFSISNIPIGNYKLTVYCIGFNKVERAVIIKELENELITIELTPDKSTLNEVVVTGVTKATLIRENPLSIISISSKMIEQTNESNIVDVLVKNVPGLNAVKTGPNISKPFIRGLGYNRVLTLYDGVRQEGQQWGDEHGIEVDAYNINKAEVIKGPASLMYGSDALAGVMSLMPFVPSTQDGKLHGKFTSEYQSNNNLIGNGLRISYANAHWLASICGSYRLAKNYRNANDGRVYNTGFDEKNISTLVGYQSNIGYSHVNFTVYDNLQGIPDGSRDSLTRKFTKQVYEGSADTIQKRPIVSNQELEAYKLSPLHQHIQHYRLYTHNYYKLGNGDIDVLLALQQNVRREYNHPTMPQQAGLFVKLNSLNYGIRYNLPKISAIETAIGINGMKQSNSSKNATDFPIPNYDLLDVGAYIHLKWKHNNWTVSGGLRYDIRTINWNDFYITTNSTTGFDQQISNNDTSNANLQYPKYKKTFSGISSSLGLTYRVNDKISIKVNVARGYRSPSITELASNGLDPGAHIIYLGNRNFNPEFSLQEDIGVSANFNVVSGSISLFNNNIQNYIYLSQVVDANANPVMDAQGNKTFKYNQASAQLYGLETWLSFRPEKLNGFSIDNSFTLIYGYNTKAVYKNKGLNGEYLPFIPPIKLMSSATQKIKTGNPAFKTLTPKVELEYSVAQKRYLALYNTESLTPAYTLLNLGISSEIGYSKNGLIQLHFQITNVLNQVYQSNLNRLKYFEYYSKSPNGTKGIFNMGRNMCVKLVFEL